MCTDVGENMRKKKFMHACDASFREQNILSHCYGRAFCCNFCNHMRPYTLGGAIQNHSEDRLTRANPSSLTIIIFVFPRCLSAIQP
jgi:hypothetical protein